MKPHQARPSARRAMRAASVAMAACCLALAACRDFGDDSAEVVARAGAGPIESVASMTRSREEALLGLNKWVKEHPGRRVANVESVYDVSGFQVTTTTFEGLQAWTLPAGAEPEAGPIAVDEIPASSAEESGVKANEWARAHPLARIVSIEAVNDVSGFKYVSSSTSGLRIWSRTLPAAPSPPASVSVH